MKETIDALQDSIFHWKRIRKYITTLDPKSTYDSRQMFKMIGENTSAGFCALCDLYHKNCTNPIYGTCPLFDYNVPTNCCKEFNEAVNSKTNKEFVTKSLKLIRKMQHIKKDLKK